MNDCDFNTDEPLAYFITWTAYGTWLPGDDRGWWRRGEFHPPNELFREMAVSEMKETAFVISREDRRIVQETVATHCQIRGWTLHTVRARSNHVHVVVTAPGYPSKTVRDQFKAWCTRHLKPRNPHRKCFWTEGGSCRWVNREDDLEAVIIYVIEAQDRKKGDAE